MHRAAVAQDPGDGLHQTQPEQSQTPAHQRVRVALGQAGLHGAAEHGRYQRLGQHPEHAERETGAEDDGVPPGEPHEVSGGRPRVGGAGIAGR